MTHIKQLANLVNKRNLIATEISALVERPALIGHVGEFIAAQIFDIELAESAVNKASDGLFRSGPLAGRSMNIKWYGKGEGLLDITPDCLPDYYLVMSGPRVNASSSRYGTRPWLIESVYLFESSSLLKALIDRGVKIGTATSVRKEHWAAAEIFPQENPDLMRLSSEQRGMLALFQSCGTL